MYLSAEMSLDIQWKAASATVYANIIYKRVPNVYSLQKERWLHYMYKITEINDILYNIYSFIFKMIQLCH